ncbi:MAG: hypothetical protein J3K34DRAFT_456086 [Monoraphidium minutum]|nr:MAG: hypothetical protein J3K34DRAFT_456086 [Monoraphidium minutum]
MEGLPGAAGAGGGGAGAGAQQQWPGGAVPWEAGAQYSWAPFAMSASPAAPGAAATAAPLASAPDDSGGGAGAAAGEVVFCQVASCGVDLSEDTPYIRRHRVCREHIRCDAVTVNGIEQRYCQQCGRFHPTDAFDGARRSCRAGLAKHNARRRHRGHQGPGRQSGGGAPRGGAPDSSCSCVSSDYDPQEDDHEDSDSGATRRRTSPPEARGRGGGRRGRGGRGGGGRLAASGGGGGGGAAGFDDPIQAALAALPRDSAAAAAQALPWAPPPPHAPAPAPVGAGWVPMAAAGAPPLAPPPPPAAAAGRAVPAGFVSRPGDAPAGDATQLHRVMQLNVVHAIDRGVSGGAAVLGIDLAADTRDGGIDSLIDSLFAAGGFQPPGRAGGAAAQGSDSSASAPLWGAAPDAGGAPPGAPPAGAWPAAPPAPAPAPPQLGKQGRPDGGDGERPPKQARQMAPPAAAPPALAASDLLADLLGFAGAGAVPSALPGAAAAFALAPVQLCCYLADTKLVRLSLKLHGLLPDELPPGVAAQLQQQMAASEAAEAGAFGGAAVMQGAIRPGCLQLTVDILVTRPPGGGAGGGAGAWATADAADAAGAAALKELLPAGRLAALFAGAAAAAAAEAAGAAGAAATGAWRVHPSRIVQAQISAHWVTAAAAGGGAGVAWAPAAEGAPRLLAALPCAAAAGADARLLVAGAGLAGGAAGGADYGASTFYARSRGFFHSVRQPPVMPAPQGGAGGGGPPKEDGGGAQQYTLLQLPGGPLHPGLLLVEAEALPRGAGGASPRHPYGPVFSNQLPVVISSDPQLISELRQLEWALLGGSGRAAAAGAAGGANGACRSAALRVLALACCCGWPAAGAAAMRALTGSPACGAALDAAGAADVDFWAVCKEAAAAGAAAMRLPPGPAGGGAPSVFHLAVASGSEAMVSALARWLADCRGGAGGGAGASPAGAGAGGAPARRALQLEPWMVEEGSGGLTPVHLSALLPHGRVAAALLRRSLVACAAWLTLRGPCGHTPAAVAAARLPAGEAAALDALARARVAAVLLRGARAAAPPAPGGAESAAGSTTAPAAESTAAAAPPAPLAPLRTEGASGSGGAAQLYKRAPPPMTAAYEDIPSPRKERGAGPDPLPPPGAAGAPDGGALPGGKPGASPPGGAGALAGAAAPPSGAGGSAPLFRIFEGVSYLLLFSLALEIALAPPPDDAPAPGGAPAWWGVARRAAHAAPLAALVGLALLAMLAGGLAMTVAHAARARAARAAARGEDAAEGGWWLQGFGDPEREVAYQESVARDHATRDVSAAAALLAVALCAPPPPWGGPVPSPALKALLVLGAALPPTAAAATPRWYARRRGAAVLASHALLMLGGLPLLLATPAAAALCGGASMLNIATAAALTAAQPSAPAHAAALVGWQALAPALRLAGAAAPPLAWGWAAAELGLAAAAVGYAFASDAARRRRFLSAPA